MATETPVSTGTYRSDPGGTGPVPYLLVRMIVGGVFLAEGIQKFLFADALGVGRFVKIGIPAPGIMAPFVGIVEIVCGALLLAGLFTRLASIPLIVDMLVAIATTKVPILIERGFWVMVHEARVDWSMLLGSVVLLLIGAGRWSLDYLLTDRRTKQNPSADLVSGRGWRRLLPGEGRAWRRTAG